MAALFDSLQIGKCFNSYDEVLIFIDNLAEEQSFPLRIYDSVEISEYNKRLSERNQIDLKWKYKFVFVTCSHYGKHNSRAQGIRPNQKVYSADCKFAFRVVFQPQAGVFKIQPQKFNRTHTNHVTSIDHFKLYKRKEKLTQNPEALQLAKSALAVGGNPTLIRNEISRSHGVFMKSKDLRNLQQSITGISSQVWTNTANLLEVLSSTKDNIVSIKTNEKGEIQCAV